MELKKAIETRASVRKFVNEPMPMEDLKEIVRLASMAPTPNNSQSWRFIAIANKETLGCMAEHVRLKIDEMFPDTDINEMEKAKEQVSWFSTFFASAPAVILIVTEPYEAIIDKMLNKSSLSHDDINEMRCYPDIQSVGACVQNIQLAAVDMGYGACWLSGPLVAREGIEKCSDIKEPWRLSAMVAIGKPDGNYTPKPKKSIDDIFEYIP